MPISNVRNEEIEREYKMPYEKLWEIFGVDVESCDRSEIKMFLSMLLDSMKLKMPTINIKSSNNDHEEEVFISLDNIQTVCNVRHIIDIDRKRLPLTISLIGNGLNKYFGIKAVTFHREKYREEGVFLRVETEEWKYNEEYIKRLAKHKKKDKLRHFYDLPQILEETGFEQIFSNLKFSQDRVPFIENKFGDVTKIDSFTRKDLNGSANYNS